jgi:8-oxo-dGTP diphosphatase
MFVRIGATAFLFNQTKVLLMKRSTTKKIAPGLWSGVGGHAEPHELNDPLATCLREVFEETGIPATAIFDLRLKYIMLRKSTPQEMRLSYFYFGRTGRTEVSQTPEGELHWVETAAVAKLEMSPTYNLMFGHYLKEGKDSAVTLVGVVAPDGTGVSWAELG